MCVFMLCFLQWIQKKEKVKKSGMIFKRVYSLLTQANLNWWADRSQVWVTQFSIWMSAFFPLKYIARKNLFRLNSPLCAFQPLVVSILFKLCLFVFISTPNLDIKSNLVFRFKSIQIHFLYFNGVLQFRKIKNRWWSSSSSKMNLPRQTGQAKPPFGRSELLFLTGPLTNPLVLRGGVAHHSSLIRPTSLHVQRCTAPLGHWRRWSSPGELGRRTQAAGLSVGRATQIGSEASSWHRTSHGKTM